MINELADQVFDIRNEESLVVTKKYRYILCILLVIDIIVNIKYYLFTIQI